MFQCFVDKILVCKFYLNAGIFFTKALFRSMFVYKASNLKSLLTTELSIHFLLWITFKNTIEQFAFNHSTHCEENCSN